MTLEHRSARSPEPIPLRLEQTPAPHLVTVNHGPPTPQPLEQSPLEKEIQQQLATLSRPLSTVELRNRLRRRKNDVIVALNSLRATGLIRRTAAGWQLSSRD